MFFLNQAKDGPLLQELIREGVINSALWEALPLPPDGYLMDVLVQNYSKIPEKAWIDWLIRNHKCTRIANIEPSLAFIKSLPRELTTLALKADTYPLFTKENALYVGIGRPDYPEQINLLKNTLKKTVIFHNSLTLNEVKNLRKLFQSSLQTM